MAEKPSLAEMLAADAQELSSSTETVDTSTPTKTESPSAETVDSSTSTAPETTDAPADATTTSEVDSTTTDESLRAWAKEKWPEKAAIIDLYKEDEEFVKGMLEAGSLVGKRNEDAEYIRKLREYGISDDDISRLIEEKRNPPSTTTTTTETTEQWNPAWVTEDEKGNWLVTAEGRKVSDIHKKIENYRSDLSAAMRDPARWDNFVEKYSGKKRADPKAEIESVKAEIAYRDLVRQQEEFKTKHKDLLFAGEGFTPFGEKVNELLLDEGFYPNLTGQWDKRADKAMKIAAAIIAPQPAKRTIPIPAKRQPAVAAGKNIKMTSGEFRNKYPNAGLYEFAQYLEQGELPK
jgi:hypothetical protein